MDHYTLEFYYGNTNDISSIDCANLGIAFKLLPSTQTPAIAL